MTIEIFMPPTMVSVAGVIFVAVLIKSIMEFKPW